MRCGRPGVAHPAPRHAGIAKATGCPALRGWDPGRMRASGRCVAARRPFWKSLCSEAHALPLHRARSPSSGASKCWGRAVYIGSIAVAVPLATCNQAGGPPHRLAMIEFSCSSIFFSLKTASRRNGTGPTVCGCSNLKRDVVCCADSLFCRSSVSQSTQITKHLRASRALPLSEGGTADVR